jgi:uncharacterized cupin superfamily protein
MSVETEVRMTDPKYIIRTGALDWSSTPRIRHPFNPMSDMKAEELGDRAGMKRLGVNLTRIPPGKQSFIPHAHSVEEEFVFVLSGAGEVVLDGIAHPIGAGDFVGFPTDGVVHHFLSLGPDDLVYLTAGERSPIEVSDLPSIGKTLVFRNDTVTLFGEDGEEAMSSAEWMARSLIED